MGRKEGESGLKWQPCDLLEMMRMELIGFGSVLCRSRLCGGGFVGGHSCGVALGVVGFGGSGICCGCFLGAVLRQEDVVKAVLLMELAEVYVALDAADAAGLAVLP